jgi:DNA-binding XRE family transcriptional regulator
MTLHEFWHTFVVSCAISRTRPCPSSLLYVHTLGTVLSMEIDIESDLSFLAEGRLLARSGRGARIRQLAGLSQAELARSIGVDASTLSRWESCQRTPRGTNAVDYARALRVLNEV